MEHNIVDIFSATSLRHMRLPSSYSLMSHAKTIYANVSLHFISLLLREALEILKISFVFFLPMGA